MSVVQNIIFGYPSWRKKVTYTGGSYVAGYPVTNLGILPLMQVARTTDLLAASTQFIGTFDRVRPVGMGGLVAHNLSTAATWRWRLYSDAARTSLLYDSGFVNVFPVSFPGGTVPWGSPYFWGGTYTAEDLAGYNITSVMILSQVYIAAAFVVEVLDPTNAAGYLQFGVFDPSEPWQPDLNVSYGLQYGFVDRSITVEALGGSESVQKMPPQRQLTGSFDFLSHAQAMANQFEFFRTALTAETFVIVLDPLDTASLIRNSFLARNSKISLATRATYDTDQVPVNIKEVLG